MSEDDYTTKVRAYLAHHDSAPVLDAVKAARDIVPPEHLVTFDEKMARCSAHLDTAREYMADADTDSGRCAELWLIRAYDEIQRHFMALMDTARWTAMAIVPMENDDERHLHALWECQVCEARGGVGYAADIPRADVVTSIISQHELESKTCHGRPSDIQLTMVIEAVKEEDV